jgi:hypothetical protein
MVPDASPLARRVRRDREIIPAEPSGCEPSPASLLWLGSHSRDDLPGTTHRGLPPPQRCGSPRDSGPLGAERGIITKVEVDVTLERAMSRNGRSKTT